MKARHKIWPFGLFYSSAAPKLSKDVLVMFLQLCDKKFINTAVSVLISDPSLYVLFTSDLAFPMGIKVLVS